MAFGKSKSELGAMFEKMDAPKVGHAIGKAPTPKGVPRAPASAGTIKHVPLDEGEFGRFRSAAIGRKLVPSTKVRSPIPKV